MNLLKVGANWCLKMLKGSIRMFNSLDASLGWFCSRVLQSLIAIHGRIHWQQQIRCQDAHILVLWWQGWALAPWNWSSNNFPPRRSLGSRGWPAEPPHRSMPLASMELFESEMAERARLITLLTCLSQNAGDSKPFRFMKPGHFPCGSQMNTNEGNPNADFMMIIAGESEYIGVLYWLHFWASHDKPISMFGCLVANPVKSVTIDLQFIAQHVVHMCIFSLTMLDTWKMPESHHSDLTTISLKMWTKASICQHANRFRRVSLLCIYNICYILLYVFFYYYYLVTTSFILRWFANIYYCS